MTIRVSFKVNEKNIDQNNRDVVRAAVRAVNLGATRGRTLASKKIRDEVALKKPYIDERLKVTQKASPNSLSAAITGRSRPTQLIRFATPSSINKMRNKKGKTRKQINNMRASVRVKRTGSLKKVKYFWVPLKSDNEGLAYRVAGTNKINPVYSVSVDQALNNARDRIEPDIFKVIEKEFNRQLGLI